MAAVQRPNSIGVGAFQLDTATAHSELPSGKYPEVEEPSRVLLVRAQQEPRPVLPKSQRTRTWTATARERHPMTSSLSGSGRAGKHGKLLGSKGSLYEGGVLAGRPHGWGCYYAQVTPGLPPVLLYEGEWVKGIRQGGGTYHYASGEVYTGDWHCNKRHGHGRLQYANGDVYEGSFSQDQRHGQGTFTSSSSGSVFVGTYVRGLRQGLGTLFCISQGKKYVAEYQDDLPRCGTFLGITSADLQPQPPSQGLAQTIAAASMQQALTGSLPASLPVIDLAQPNKVLERQMVALRQQLPKRSRQAAAEAAAAAAAAAASGALTPVTLNADEISLLRHAFIIMAGGDGPEVFVQPRQLVELVVLAGQDPAAPASQIMMQQLAARAVGPEQQISLDAFLHVVLHLVPQQQQGKQQQDQELGVEDQGDVGQHDPTGQGQEGDMVLKEE